MAGIDEDQILSEFEKSAFSFVIRIWKENRADPSCEPFWRGWLQHVQTGQKIYFHETNEIARIIDQYLDSDAEINRIFEPLQSTLDSEP